ncbi:MAG: GYD domain superfamily [Chloroflexi bacterium]|nr:MAG: GYD domain superfamily [Chloroflexota bacterium]
MALYVMLTTLTDEGRRTIKEKPDRIREVNKEVESMGVKVVTQYAVMGPYDFVNIIEAPSNEIVAKVAVELGARGTLQTMTMPAIPLDDLVKALKS